MVPSLRSAFNASWTPEKYAQFLHQLEAGLGEAPGFRNCETPCFFPQAVLDRLVEEGSAMIHQLTSDAEYRKRSDSTIPPEYHVPNEDPLPLFLQVDFGLTEDNQPKLVEIQAFPSLYAYQPYLAETYRTAYGLDPALQCFLGGLNSESYTALLREAIVAGHDPENVVLLEIEPSKQKTKCDFTLTERMLGVRPVCLTAVRKEGRRLFYDRDGKQTEIRRIYNRAIVDELARKPHIQPGFDFRDELDVEWAGHPNWYFRISKFSIPFLRQASVPKTQFLSDVAELPADLENYVLKPLYSFAGLGVVVGPTREDFDRIPEAQRDQYILQERVNFASPIETPHGPTKAEIRVMYIWTDQLRAVNTIVRMGRGKMMGVDHNKNLEWVGASAGFVI
ncbi:hypothetical protein F183_A17820 [Bryobacterales bacterium F-183]|nr:hypothetical protein F183_A17820 [Bryobacterales bacterium F-183]